MTAARLDSLRAHLELLGALRRAERMGRPSRLSVRDWQLLLSPLTVRQRRVVVLRCLAGMQLKDVGARLGLSPKLVFWYWKRSLAVMRVFWEQGDW